MPGVTIQPQIQPDLKMSSDKCQVCGTGWHEVMTAFRFQNTHVRWNEKVFQAFVWKSQHGISLSAHLFMWDFPMKLLPKQMHTHFWYFQTDNVAENSKFSQTKNLDGGRLVPANNAVSHFLMITTVFGIESSRNWNSTEINMQHFGELMNAFTRSIN